MKDTAAEIVIRLAVKKHRDSLPDDAQIGSAVAVALATAEKQYEARDYPGFLANTMYAAFLAAHGGWSESDISQVFFRDPFRGRAMITDVQSFEEAAEGMAEVLFAHENFKEAFLEVRRMVFEGADIFDDLAQYAHNIAKAMSLAMDHNGIGKDARLIAVETLEALRRIMSRMRQDDSFVDSDLANGRYQLTMDTIKESDEDNEIAQAVGVAFTYIVSAASLGDADCAFIKMASAVIDETLEKMEKLVSRGLKEATKEAKSAERPSILKTLFGRWLGNNN